ncbi:hypothetical protein N9T59_00895 [Paracoccaceae bacterium]|jgi:hypothetical protein|nr:hypothetical protein [Paracoccaceae bacterium]
MTNFFDVISKAIMKQRRKMLARTIFDRYDGVVQRGPYANMKLGNRSNISQGPLGLKILGLYENIVVEKIASLKEFDDFINFGAADGYMALGPLFNKSCKRAICFEMTEEGRASVKRNAEMNNLSKDLVLEGEVNSGAVNLLEELKVNPIRSVVLCDIEGAEFSVLTKQVFSFLRGATIIIELHDKLMNDGHGLREKLMENIPKEANLDILSYKQVASFEGISDLEELNDSDRALVMSEGRKYFGEWLVVEYPNG